MPLLYLNDMNDEKTISDSQTRIDSLLQQAQLVSECVNTATEVLFVLNGKRETLEEKAIKQVLHKLVIALSQYVEKLHERCLKKEYPDETKIQAAGKLFEEIRLSVSELLKTARYDLNFLEQYFEYDYCGKLMNEYHFVERVESFTAD